MTQTRAVIDRAAGDSARAALLHRRRMRDRSTRCADRIVPQPTDRAADPGRRAGRRQAAAATAATAIAAPACRASARPGGAGCARSMRRPARPMARRSASSPPDAAGRAAARACRRASCTIAAWGGMPPKTFFQHRMAPRHRARLLRASRSAWNEIGWGGPASPRGYVRMGFDERDPWEAAEAHRRRRGGRATEEPPCRMIRCRRRARATAARPTCSAPAPGCRCGEYRDDEAVDFVIVGTGAGGGTLACRLAEAGFSVVAFDAGPYFRPLEDFASDESEQTKLYWTDDRIVDGDNPLQLGSNNSGKAVGGSTVHFAMVSLRFRPEWFKSRSLLGYGADWPLDWREMWRYYAEVEQALKISGPVTYPWGPKRPRYPYRAHEMNAAGAGAGARAARRWASTGPRRRSPRCRRRAGWRIPASIAASASPAARPTPSRARWSPGFRARSRPAPKSAISRWSGAIEIDSAGPRDRRALSPRGALALPARAQRRRRRLRHRDAAAAAELGHARAFPTGSPTAPAWSART